VIYVSLAGALDQVSVVCLYGQLRGYDVGPDVRTVSEDLY